MEVPLVRPGSPGVTEKETKMIVRGSRFGWNTGSGISRVIIALLLTFGTTQVDVLSAHAAAAKEAVRGSQAFDIADVVRNAHFAFRPIADGTFQTRHDNYRIAVDPSGRIRFRAADPTHTGADPGAGNPGSSLVSEEAAIETVAVHRDGARRNSETTVEVSRGKISIDRGSARESLAADEVGVHQQWRFEAKPDGTGDLVVRLRVGGFLFERQTDDGLHFYDETTRLGFVYSHATWIDADGRRLSVQAVWQSGEIALRVPADALERSTYPAVLDPYITPEFDIDEPIPGSPLDRVSNYSFSDGPSSRLLVWEDSRNTVDQDLYAARIASDGTVLDPLGIVVASGLGRQQYPRAAYADNGWIVVWEDDRNKGCFRIWYESGPCINPMPEVFFQRIGDDGILVGDNVSLSDDTDAYHGYYQPDIACGPSSCLVVMQNHVGQNFDYRDGRIARFRIGFDGTVLDDLLVIATGGHDDYPTIAYNGDRYFVVWRDFRDGSLPSVSNCYTGTNPNVYGQFVSADGTPIGENVAVSTDVNYQTYPVVEAGNAGFLVVWGDYRHGQNPSQCYNDGSNPVIYGQVVLPDGALYQDNIRLLYDTYASQASVCHDGTRYMVYPGGPVSETGRTGGVYATTGGYMQCDADSVDFLRKDEIEGIEWFTYGSYEMLPEYDDAGPISEFAAVTDSLDGETDPSISGDGTTWLTVWEDDRNAATTGVDIYAARIDETGTVLAPGGFPLVTDEGDQTNPSIAYGNGKYLLTWQDADQVTGQFVSTEGVLLGDPLWTNSGKQPNVAFGNGHWHVVSADSYFFNNFYRVGGRFVEDDGFVGAVITYNQGSTQLPIYSVPRTTFGDGHWLTVWQRGFFNLVNGRMVDDSGTALGDVFSVSDVGETCEEKQPSVAYSNGEFLVAFTTEEEGGLCGSLNIKAKTYAADTGAYTGFLWVTDGDGDQSAPSVVSTDDGYAILWDCVANDETGVLMREYIGSADYWSPASSLGQSPIMGQSAMAAANAKTAIVWSDTESGSPDLYAQLVGDYRYIEPSQTTTLPLISNNTEAEPSVSFDGTHYLLVWSDNRNGNDDIFGVRIDTAGNVVDSNPIVITTSGEDDVDPSVDAGDGAWLVSWLAPNGNEVETRVRRVLADGSLPDAAPIALGSASLGYVPQVAFGDDSWLVVWSEFSSRSVWGTRVGTDGSVLDPTPREFFDDPFWSWYYTTLDVVFYAGRWLVLTVGHGSGMPGRPITQALVDADQTMGDIILVADRSVGFGEARIAAAAGGFLVAWTESTTRIRGRLLDGGGVPLGDESFLIAQKNGYLSDLSVERDGEHYWISWTDQAGSRYEAASRTIIRSTWIEDNGIALDSSGEILVEENPIPRALATAIDGDGASLLAYVRHDDEAGGSPQIRGRILHRPFDFVDSLVLPDSDAVVTWVANANLPGAASVNVSRSLSFSDGYQKLNAAPLPLTGSFTDADAYLGMTNFYLVELVTSDGTVIEDPRGKTWVTPAAPETTFLVSVRESTVAAVPGNASAFDVHLIPQKGYVGTLTLGVTGLGTEAESWSFDPPTVDVPGRSTLTVAWDPLLVPPAGGSEVPFQITATETSRASASTKTVDVLGVVIDPDDHYLTQFVYPSEPEAGHNVEVFGRLTPHEPGQTVAVESGTALDLYTAITDAEGFFSLSLPIASAGTRQFTSSASGAASAPYVTDIKRGRRRVRMSVATADGLIDPGDLVVIEGEVDPNPGPGWVHLTVVNPDETDAFRGDVSVDGYGTFQKSFLAREGVTTVEAEYEGDADYFDASARLNVPVNAPIGMAIVVAGGGETTDPNWAANVSLCDRAHEVYKGRLIPEERIRYLHPDAAHDPDGDGTPEVAAPPTRADLQASIETWAAGLVDISATWAPFKTPLTLYIAASRESTGSIRLNDNETLTVAELGGWLDAFLANIQARYDDPEVGSDPPESVPINVVLEFEESGAFVQGLSGESRIIVTSTGDSLDGSAGYPGWNETDEYTMAFSYNFYDGIDEGEYIATAWSVAAYEALWHSWYSQWPLIDANGNGVPNEDVDQIDGDGAGDKVLEYRNTFEQRPAIDLIFSGLTVPQGRSDGLLWARVLDNPYSVVDRVQCVVWPPSGSGEPMRKYRMQWNASQQRYELNHDGFRHRGLYKILITAVDEDEDAALPWMSLVDVHSDTLGEDTTPPEDVTDLYSQAQDGQVYLSWTESISSDVAGYYVYTKPAGGSYGTGVYAGNGDHYTVTGLTNGAAYSFKITAIDEVPNESTGVETGVITPRGADFAADATEVLPNTTVQFTDLSTGAPTGWSWDLDGDSIADSAAQHPSHLYTALGTYTVTLTATYADGNDAETKTDYISVQSQVAGFSATPTHGTLPMSVQFTDESIAEGAITAWAWDFNGDSVADSTDQHPLYQYDAPGEYDVTLAVTTSGGSDTETKEGYIVVACPSPDPTFTSDVTSGAAPLDVTFTSTTEAPANGCDPTAWAWTFGDSASGSGEQVQHTYTEDGLYGVCLTVTVPGTSAQTCVVDYVEVGGGCASGNLCLTLLLAGYWDGTEQSTEAYLTVDFYADPAAAPSYRITNVQLDVDGTAVVDLTAAGVIPGAYYVVARPFNHLDVMSELALTVGGLAAAGLDADFSDPTQVACGEAALVFVGERWCAPGGDASGDGQVDLSDYSLLAQQWGLAGPDADFTGDAVVDLSDYSNLAQGWSRQMCEDVPGSE